MPLDFLKVSNIRTLIASKNAMILLIALFVVSISAPNALAANYYVDNTATGLNNGTSWTNAWQSFAAITWGGNGVVAGDTLYISGGTTSKTYNEQLTPTGDGASGNPITIRTGQDAGHNGLVIIDAQTTRNNCIRLSSINYMIVSGEKNGTINMKCRDTVQHGISVSGSPIGVIITYIEVDNAGTSDGMHGIAFASNNVANNGNEISYCSVHDAYQDAIQGGTLPVTAYAYLKIHHNNIYNVSDDGIQSGGGLDIYNNNIGGMRVPPRGSGHPDGIQAMGGHVRIYNNVFTESGHANIFVDPINVTGLIVENIYIYNNIFEGDDGDYLAIKIKGDTPNPPDGFNNVYVLNNTIIDMGTDGIIIYNAISGGGTWTNTLVYNNIVYNSYRNNATAAVVSMGVGDYTTSDVIIDYNTVHEGNSGTSIFNWDGTSYSYNNFVSAGLGQAHGNHVKPMFVSYSEGTTGNNLRLSSSDRSSKNLGIDLSTYFNTDFYGVLRPQGLAWDIGAIESVADTTQPSPPFNLR